LIRRHNRTAVVRDINLESGVHLFIRAIRSRVLHHRDIVAKLSRKTNSRFHTGVRYSPMTISLSMPCFLNCKSKSVLAKPLELQCSRATMSPGCGSNPRRISPPHAAVLERLARPRCFLNRRNVLPGLVIARTVSVMQRIEDLSCPSAQHRGLASYDSEGRELERQVLHHGGVCGRQSAGIHDSSNQPSRTAFMALVRNG